jgi:hypothetical protein
MAQPREIITDRLVGLIASIKMERGSGQLWVRRGEGLTSEEGILTFIQGQITRASVGRRSGAEALNWLCTWGQARYIFVATGSSDGSARIFAVPPLSEPGRATTNSGPRAAQVTTDRLETEPLQRAGREVPRSRVDFNEANRRIERAGLTRSHRRLYLLINGQRSVDELKLLMGRKLEEVRSMLHDLEWLEIIQV